MLLFASLQYINNKHQPPSHAPPCPVYTYRKTTAKNGTQSKPPAYVHIPRTAFHKIMCHRMCMSPYSLHNKHDTLWHDRSMCCLRQTFMVHITGFCDLLLCCFRPTFMVHNTRCCDQYMLSQTTHNQITTHGVVNNKCMSKTTHNQITTPGVVNHKCMSQSNE